MKEEYQRNRILARGKEVFIGIDVHKESWQVTVRTEGEEMNCTTRQDSLVRVFNEETNI